MRDNTSTKTLSPTKSGKIYGKVKPSLGKNNLNRAERRRGSKHGQ